MTQWRKVAMAQRGGECRRGLAASDFKRDEREVRSESGARMVAMASREI